MMVDAGNGNGDPRRSLRAGADALPYFVIGEISEERGLVIGRRVGLIPRIDWYHAAKYWQRQSVHY